MQIGEHLGQGGYVGGVAGEHVMRDRDPVAGGEQPDHHLGTVGPVITRVAERARREPHRGGDRAFEEGRGQVVADQGELQVGQVGQPRVQERLQLGLDVVDVVQRPVVLLQAGKREPVWGHDLVGDPAHDLASGARVDQPVGDHREHRIRKRPAQPLAPGRLVEPRLQPQPTPPRLHRGDPAQGRSVAGLEVLAAHPCGLGMGLERGDDAVELATVAQLGHLAQAGDGAVAGLARLVPEGLDQRQVLVGLAPTPHLRGLHEHAGHCRPQNMEKQASKPILCPYIGRAVQT
ncbi:MAG TPA: hypothetical protein VHF25_14490 [Nitriliruptorales bacterium]|nr:hypothetical protein [Nitriliruptorales bacterium]